MRYRLRRFGGADADVAIPVDVGGGSLSKRTERAVRWLWSRGIYPGPAAVSLRLHGHVRPSRTLNGVETKVRNRILGELGVGRQRRDPRFGGFA